MQRFLPFLLVAVGMHGIQTPLLVATGDSTIRRLNLSGNNVGDKGATLLAEMLKVIPKQAPFSIWSQGHPWTIEASV